MIEGYRDEDGRELVAVFQKMHHATVDGVSGANLISHLCSLEPDAEPLGAEQDEEGVAARARPAELLGRGLRHQRHPAVLDLRPDRADGEGRGRHHRPGPRRYGDGRSAHRPADVVQRHHHRAAARSRWPRWTSTTIKEVKAATGTTVNDVVLAVAGGALRSYLEDRDELPDELAARHRAGLGAIGVDALRGRQQGLRAVHPARYRRRGPAGAARGDGDANRNAKEHQKAISADSLQDWAEFAAPRTFGLAVRAYAALRLAEKHPVVHNLVISNVPGPAVAALLHGRPDRGAASARPGLPRRRPQHHRDVQQRPGRRRR